MNKGCLKNDDTRFIFSELLLIFYLAGVLQPTMKCCRLSSYKSKVLGFMLIVVDLVCVFLHCVKRESIYPSLVLEMCVNNLFISVCDRFGLNLTTKDWRLSQMKLRRESQIEQNNPTI